MVKINNVRTNATINLLYQFLIIIFPVILIPYLSRTLKADAVGTFSYVNSIVLYFVYLASLGTNIYGNRITAMNRENKSKMNSMFWEIIFLKVMSFTVSTMFYILFIVFFVNDYTQIFYIFILLLFANLIDISWFYMGQESFFVLFLRNVILKSSFFILVIFFVKNPNDLIIYTLIFAGLEFLGNISLWIGIKKHHIKFSPTFPRIGKIFKHFKNSISLFIPQVVIQVYTIMNITFLGYLSTKAEVAFYDYSSRIIYILLVISTSLSMVMLPKISNLYSNNDFETIKYYLSRSLSIALFIGLPLMFGTISISSILVPWFFGPGFEKIGMLLLFLAFKILFVIISNVIGMQYLVPTGQNRKFLFSVLVGALINIVMNIVLIPHLGSMGVVISVLISEFVVAITMVIIVKNELNIVLMIIKNYKLFLSSVIMMVISLILVSEMSDRFIKLLDRFINDYTFSSIIITLAIIIISSIVYFSLLIILKEKNILFFIGICKNMLKIK